MLPTSSRGEIYFGRSNFLYKLLLDAISDGERTIRVAIYKEKELFGVDVFSDWNVENSISTLSDWTGCKVLIVLEDY